MNEGAENTVTQLEQTMENVITSGRATVVEEMRPAVGLALLRNEITSTGAKVLATVINGSDPQQ